LEYTPGLHIRWTDKEWAKIQEIKARRSREKQKEFTVSWDKIEEYKRAEKKQKRNFAIASLYDYGYTIIEIAKLFNLGYNTVFHVVHREGK
jgi:DNA-binding NarL/FixJ family response regulator